ncbi:PAS domain-containing protein [bacterium]|nr:PAS domain-containing protein [bacterium]
MSWLAYRAKRNGSACDHNASLAAVIDSTGQSVCVLDQDLRVVDYNHAWHDLWLKAGQPPSDVVEDNFKNLCEAMRINGTSA